MNQLYTGVHTLLIVQDTGVGIAPEHLPHIFERFYRGDQARQRTHDHSSGLGLAIVDWIVRAHGGDDCRGQSGWPGINLSRDLSRGTSRGAERRKGEKCQLAVATETIGGGA